MIDELIKDAESRMKKSIESLKGDLTKIRTGRAHPSLLEHLTVEYYGSEVPLNQVANISVGDSRTLNVTPWEKPMVPVVEKAIINSDMGLNPATAGEIIRVPLPPLTEERRKDLIKVVRKEGEATKVAIRNIRRDANENLKDMEEEKLISKDELHQNMETVQKTTDSFIQKIDDVLGEKEKEILEI